MKKIYILIVTTLLLAGTATAQNRFDATVFGGINLNQIDGDDAGGFGQMGLRGGVGTSFSIGHDAQSPWRMVVELAYSQRGSSINNGSIQRDITLNYVELPLMMSYTLLNNKLRLSAGVAPAVQVGARVIDGNGIRNSEQEAKYTRFDWLPVVVSARYMVSYHLAVELRYQTSMLSIYDHPSSGTYRLWRENKGAFNRSLSIGLSYSFLN